MGHSGELDQPVRKKTRIAAPIGAGAGCGAPALPVTSLDAGETARSTVWSAASKQVPASAL